MSQLDPATRSRVFKVLYVYSFIALSTQVVNGFVSARHLYLERCEHTSPSQFTALLLGLVLVSSLLAILLLTGVVYYRQRKVDASSEPPRA